MLTKINKWLDELERIITIITAAMLVILAILVCTQVFTRYVLSNQFVMKVLNHNMNFFWIEEISVTLMMWIGLFGAAGCVWTDSHMNLNLVLERIPSKIQIWVRVFIDIMIGVYSFVLLREGIILTYQTMGGTMPTVKIPVGYTYIILPISAGFMLIFSVIKAIKKIFDYYFNKESNKKSIKKESGKK